METTVFLNVWLFFNLHFKLLTLKFLILGTKKKSVCVRERGGRSLARGQETIPSLSLQNHFPVKVGAKSRRNSPRLTRLNYLSVRHFWPCAMIYFRRTAHRKKHRCGNHSSSTQLASTWPSPVTRGALLTPRRLEVKLSLVNPFMVGRRGWFTKTVWAALKNFSYGRNVDIVHSMSCIISEDMF